MCACVCVCVHVSPSKASKDEKLAVRIQKEAEMIDSPNGLVANDLVLQEHVCPSHLSHA